METEKSPSELVDSPEYQELVDQINDYREELDTTITDFDDDDFIGLFQRLPVSSLPPLMDDD